jgi:hypothetical protein
MPSLQELITLGEVGTMYFLLPGDLALPMLLLRKKCILISASKALLGGKFLLHSPTFNTNSNQKFCAHAVIVKMSLATPYFDYSGEEWIRDVHIY